MLRCLKHWKRESGERWKKREETERYRGQNPPRLSIVVETAKIF